MSAPRLYVESTIPSYLAAPVSSNPRTAGIQKATTLWWETRRTSFGLFVSTVVVDEITRGNPVFAAKRLETVAGIDILVSTPASEQLTDRLLADDIIPAVAAGDAAHIAVAAVNQMAFLLTWNCKHINNRFVVRRIERACSAEGYACPTIATPTELMNI